MTKLKKSSPVKQKSPVKKNRSARKNKKRQNMDGVDRERMERQNAASKKLTTEESSKICPIM
jgi:hypothetical protein